MVPMSPMEIGTGRPAAGRSPSGPSLGAPDRSGQSAALASPDRTPTPTRYLRGRSRATRSRPRGARFSARHGFRASLCAPRRFGSLRAHATAPMGRAEPASACSAQETAKLRGCCGPSPRAAFGHRSPLEGGATPSVPWRPNQPRSRRLRLPESVGASFRRGGGSRSGPSRRVRKGGSERPPMIPQVPACSGATGRRCCLPAGFGVPSGPCEPTCGAEA